MNKRNHYNQQKKYFDKEFSSVKKYNLAVWQKSYIDRIKIHLLDKNFKKKTLLDIATGTGYVAVEMAKLGINVIACDLSKESLNNLARYKKKFNLKNLEILECKAEEIPLKNKSFDYIVANAILEHIPDEQQAIRQWKNLLKPGGRMFITVPLKLRYIWPFLWVPNILHDRKIGHLRRYDLKTLQNKFKLITLKYFYTGHMVKIFSVILSIIFKINKFDEFFEKSDRKKEQILYGANNISIIFEK